MLRNTQQADEPTTIEREERSETPTKSRRTKILQGLTVFVVMFVTMYTALRWALSRDEAQVE